MLTFLVTRFPSSSVNCSSITDSPGMFLASSPWGEGEGRSDRSTGGGEEIRRRLLHLRDIKPLFIAHAKRKTFIQQPRLHKYSLRSKPRGCIATHAGFGKPHVCSIRFSAVESSCRLALKDSLTSQTHSKTFHHQHHKAKTTTSTACLHSG